jgi:hypothetical protein
MFAGVTAMDTSVGGGTTVRFVEDEIAPEVARTLVLPVATADARPVLVMVATAVLVEIHVAVLVRSCVLPSV